MEIKEISTSQPEEKNELLESFEKTENTSLGKSFSTSPKELLEDLKYIENEHPENLKYITDDFKKEITKKLFKENLGTTFEKVFTYDEDAKKEKMETIQMIYDSSSEDFNETDETDEINEINEISKNFSSDEEFRHEMIKRRTKQGKYSSKIKRASVQALEHCYSDVPSTFDFGTILEPNLTRKEKFYRFIDKILVKFIPVKKPYKPSKPYTNIIDGLLDRISNDKNCLEFKRRFKRKIRSQIKNEIHKWKDFDKKISSL